MTVNKQYQLFNCLLDTIKSLDDNSISDEDMGGVLEDLEGEYYTFMHRDNVTLLMQDGYISQSAGDGILELRFKIGAVPADLWTVDDYKNGRHWQYIRNRASEILKEMRALW
jgi:hypothetical protein